MEHSLLFTKLNYAVFIVLMMLGLWAMISKKNLIKKVMGMGIFQSAIILFYVSIATKDPGASIPIYPHDLIHPPHDEHVEAHAEVADHASHADTAHAVVDAHAGHVHAEHADTAHAIVDAHADDSHAELSHDAHADESHGGHAKIADKVNPDEFNNPLPHVLMLTAIVVGVATLGVALSLIQRIYRLYGSIEEDEVLSAIEKDSSDGLDSASLTTAKQESADNHA